MYRFRSILTIAGTGLVLHATPATGDDSSARQTHTQYNINYRQMAVPAPVGAPELPTPITSSSSYNYWWPFPPGGVYTTTSSTLVNTIATPLSEPLSLGIPLSSGFVATESTAVDPVDIDTTNSNLNTSSVPSSTTESTQSFITINASASPESPTSSFVVYPKTHSTAQDSQKTMMYLIPVFVILGVLLGSGVTWIAWGCLTRKPRVIDYTGDGEVVTRKRGWRRRPRRSELEIGGPAYCPSLSEAEDATLDDNHEDMEKKSILIDRGLVEVDGWHELDANEAKDADTCERDLEKAYLMPYSANTKNSKPRPLPSFVRNHTRSIRLLDNPRARGLSRAATQKTAASVSVYSQVDDDDYDDEEDKEETEPVDKNFRDRLADNTSFLEECESDFDPRSPRFNHQITETPVSKSRISSTPSKRTVSVSRRRTRPNGHKRTDSDFNLDDIAASASPGGDLSRSVTSVTARTFTSTRTGAGFRIIEGSPLPTPAVSPGPSRAASPAGAGASLGNGGFFWNDTPSTAFPPLPPKKDKYTSIPQRNRSRSPTKPPKSTESTPSRRTGNHRQGGIVEDAVGRSGTRTFAASHSSTNFRDEDFRRALPSSPPQVSSPKLAGELCFKP
ncbi:hypothetical protein VKT23_017917 [Stygiomarasmius scandens]|uniref:Uncharacterized protein n=1 Tax=Marasmiellus scandens TaxID=2682957 RepID=A0ABR1ITG8_9AGAR